MFISLYTGLSRGATVVSIETLTRIFEAIIRLANLVLLYCFYKEQKR